jgi:hypothetical protein
MSRLWAVPLVLLGALLLSPPARAQSAPEQAPAQSPAQIQALIASGQTGQAIQALDSVLATHTKSGVAWYLMAEAYDAKNDETDAGAALNMAERCSPGLPFANQQDLAAMRARIAAAQPQSVRNGGHTALLVIGGLLLLMLLLHFLPSRRPRTVYDLPPAPPPGTPPYGFGYGPPGGGGLGSALMGGLAAGAGFAAGERIIDGMTGQGGLPQGNDPSRDDGLMGNPGWDDLGDTSHDDLSNTDWS